MGRVITTQTPFSQAKIRIIWIVSVSVTLESGFTTYIDDQCLAFLELPVRVEVPNVRITANIVGPFLVEEWELVWVLFLEPFRPPGKHERGAGNKQPCECTQLVTYATHTHTNTKRR